MKKIKLTRGKFTLVDDEDFEWLNQFKWHFHKIKNNTGYATRGVWNKVTKKQKTTGMHRIILNSPKGFHVDHIDNNGLDNRRSNLRICTNAQNLRNMRVIKRGTSQYKGVSWQAPLKKWRATIEISGKSMYLGYYMDEVEAAEVYDKAAIKYFKEFACLNFPITKHGVVKNG